MRSSEVMEIEQANNGYTSSLKNLAVALCAFQAEQKPIKPNATNPFLKNKYADLTALIEGTKENLNKHGLAVTQLLRNDGLTTMLLHTSGEYLSSTFKIEPTEGKGTNRAQEMGVAITYSRRYAYAAILGLVTDEDTDGSTPPPKKPAEHTETPPESTQKVKPKSSPKRAETQESASEDVKLTFEQKQKLVAGMLNKMFKEAEYPDKLQTYSSFEGRDGKLVQIRSLNQLKPDNEKWLNTIIGKVSKDFIEKFGDNSYNEQKELATTNI